MVLWAHFWIYQHNIQMQFWHDLKNSSYSSIPYAISLLHKIFWLDCQVAIKRLNVAIMTATWKNERNGQTTLKKRQFEPFSMPNDNISVYLKADFKIGIKNLFSWTLVEKGHLILVNFQGKWSKSYRSRQYYESKVLHNAEVTWFSTSLRSLKTKYFDKKS